MRRNVAGMGLAVVLGAGAAACGGSVGEQGLTDVPLGAEACAHSGVDGVSCYPTTDFGWTARTRTKDGTLQYGDRLQNFKFLGRRAPTPLALDTTKPPDTVQMADFFDPRGEQYELLVVTVCASWCNVCQQLAQEEQAKQEAYAAKHVTFFYVLSEGYEHEAATLASLDRLIGDVGFTLATAIDPKVTTLGGAFAQAALPVLLTVDPRTMEILQTGAGAPADLDGFVDKYLADVRANPRKR